MSWNEKNANMYMGIVNSVEKFASGALDSQINAVIRKKAVIGALCMALPLWGIETIVYAITLWGTYSKISDISGVPFRSNFVKNALSGFILNIVVTFVLGLALDFIPVFGWIGSALLGFLSIQLSGMGYVKALKLAHGRKAKKDVNIKKGISNLKKKIDMSDHQKELDETLGTVKRTNRFLDAVENKDVEEIANIVQEHKESQLPKEIQQPKEEAIAPDNTIDVSSKSNIEKLRELKALLDEGILTQEEFAAEKKKVLETT